MHVAHPFMIPYKSLSLGGRSAFFKMQGPKLGDLGCHMRQRSFNTSSKKCLLILLKKIYFLLPVMCQEQFWIVYNSR